MSITSTEAGEEWWVRPTNALPAAGSRMVLELPPYSSPVGEALDGEGKHGGSDADDDRVREGTGRVSGEATPRA